MEEVINPLSKAAIKKILRTAQAFIGRSSIALEREYPRSRRRHPTSNVYLIPCKESSILWIPNIFEVCDMSLVQFNNAVDIEGCFDLCNNTLESIKPNVWVDEDTIIQYYSEASGQHNFLIGWKYSCLLR
ncbi:MULTISPECIES: hypothetical protein [unclassified Dysgonomonas]|uniref:hypothetical protein n=1 Tax=unclassified Dysgonomonas TaxID=2630389 RepID=UPI0006837E35|nr:MULTISPECIES: hypothetical protein [unclassified Dysgonomonas]MBD8349413.1 hypothetical protein [Dysgonomonas sp. HGC4]MBF0577984.1 hypothetical protein [Dysgonomonas sp. GY617]